MTDPVTAQHDCPTRADLQRGLRLVADDPRESRIFIETDFGLLEKPVAENGAASQFADLPTWLSVGAPHAILPGVMETPRGIAHVVYYFDDIADDQFDLSMGAAFARLFSNLADGETVTVDGRVDWGTWRMLGLSFWNAADGRVAVTRMSTPQDFSHALGGCVYQLSTYRIDFQVDGASWLFRDVHFAPDLGLVLGYTSLDEAGSPNETRWFSGLIREDFPY